MYEAMLLDVLELASSVPGFDRRCLYWAGSSGVLAAPGIREVSQTFHNCRQVGQDLGLRMYNAMRDEIALGSRRVVLIGCDSPDLPPEYVRQAVHVLEAVPFVLGPSEDGGYYLIGASRLMREPFEGVQWGSSSVLANTLDILRENDVRFFLLPAWYDIDRPEDLYRLKESMRPEGARHLRALLSTLRVFAS
jgi:rSAM/selenodomain-associated transferase 1